MIDFPMQLKNKRDNGRLGHVKKRKTFLMRCDKLARYFPAHLSFGC